MALALNTQHIPHTPRIGPLTPMAATGYEEFKTITAEREDGETVTLTVYTNPIRVIDDAGNVLLTVSDSRDALRAVGLDPDA